MKILVLGGKRGGKSTLISKFIQAKLSNLRGKTLVTLTIQQRVFYSKVNDKIIANPIIFKITELCGLKLLKQFSIETDVFLLVYNVNDDKSWNFVKRVYEDVKVFEKPIFLCGMGLDLVAPESVQRSLFRSSTISGSSTSSLPSRKVPLAGVKAWADERSLTLFETSIEEPKVIESIFRTIATMPLQPRFNQEAQDKSKSLFSRMSISLPNFGKRKSTLDKSTVQTPTESNAREYQISHHLLTNTVINLSPTLGFSQLLHDRDLAWQTQNLT